MQFEASSTQLSATITELIEHMREAAYQEGCRAAGLADEFDAETDDDAGRVLTILRSPMPSSLGKYFPAARLMLLADDLPAEMRREVVQQLLTDPEDVERHASPSVH